jgi:translation initiation factor 2-alpha kinase 4
MELEQLYLEEALQTLTNPQSGSYQQILESLFARPTPDLIEVTYDTDAACKANNMGNILQGNKRTLTPSEGLMRAIGDIRATGALNVEALTSLAMSASSLVSATSALRRARNTGKKGKGTMKRSAQRVAGILSMNAASSAAITGATDGVHGADPRVVEAICDDLRSIFVEHGAVHLKAPLMRPRPNMNESAIGGAAEVNAAEVLNSRGTILLLPEDLTVSFARALGRGGAATSNVKRYDFDRVFHKSLVGGHPRESLEASFDIVHEDPKGTGDQLEAEALMVVCQAMSSFASMKSKIVAPGRFLVV